MQSRDYVLQPMLAQMLLTLVVWIYMYVVRLHFLHRNGVDPELLKTPVSAVRIIPGEVNYAAYNHQNLFELPVIFYSLCLLLYVTDSVTVLTLGLAWAGHHGVPWRVLGNGSNRLRYFRHRLPASVSSRYRV